MPNFISYDQWLNEAQITAKINKHMSHAEDLVILSGRDGLNWVIDMFKELYSLLKGDTETDKIKLSIKFDGAPAVFAWSEFPGLSEAGIAIKGLFAKNPKILYTEKQIDHWYGDQPDLSKKLKLLLKYLPSLKIPKNQIWQGDFLYDKDTLISRGNYYLFHPNTIVYQVPKDSDLGEKIKKSDLGIVWHTRYLGSSIEDISAQYNTKVSELAENSKVFMTDPYIASLAGYVTLTEDENHRFDEEIYSIDTLLKNLYKSPEYNNILENNILINLFTIYQNFLIRQNVKLDDPLEFIKGFIVFISERYEKEMAKRKTEAAISKVRNELNDLLDTIETNIKTLQAVVSAILGITKLKNMFIKKLNNIGKFETYLRTVEDKYVSTGEEGFAVSDIHGNVVKLVDRYEFSFANFSPSIKKGWSK